MEGLIFGILRYFRQHGFRNNFPLSFFVFVDSLVVSALQDDVGYAISYVLLMNITDCIFLGSFGCTLKSEKLKI